MNPCGNGSDDVNVFEAKYELAEELGKGAFSVVYKCRTKDEVNEEYAVKVFELSKLKPSEIVKIEKEYLISSRLDHKNIVKAFGLYHTSTIVYMVFEILRGGELFDMLVTKEFYTEKEASAVMECLLSTVAYCHNLNVVHRDIKPENLLLSTPENECAIKLADFGLAFEVDDSEERNYGFAGTPGYLAPELILKQPYGRPIDLWACGIVLYMLLSGIFPFYEDDTREMCRSVVNDDVDLTDEIWGNISPEAKSLVLNLLEKDPKKRSTALQALEHPWIKNRENVAKCYHKSDTLDQLRRWNVRRKLKKAIWSHIAAQKFMMLLDKVSSPANEMNAVDGCISTTNFSNIPHSKQD